MSRHRNQPITITTFSLLAISQIPSRINSTNLRNIKTTIVDSIGLWVMRMFRRVVIPICFNFFLPPSLSLSLFISAKCKNKIACNTTQFFLKKNHLHLLSETSIKINKQNIFFFWVKKSGILRKKKTNQKTFN